jgi:hypothetical protein
VGDRSLLLRVGLGRQEDVGVVAGSVPEGRDRDDEVGGPEGAMPAGWVGEVADRVGLPEDQTGELT